MILLILEIYIFIGIVITIINYKTFENIMISCLKDIPQSSMVDSKTTNNIIILAILIMGSIFWPLFLYESLYEKLF